VRSTTYALRWTTLVYELAPLIIRREAAPAIVETLNFLNAMQLGAPPPWRAKPSCSEELLHAQLVDRALMLARR
jgi:hypothetical protein